MPLSRTLLRAAPAVLVLLAACAEERAPINRVQPNVVRKADLDGEWYFQQTVVDLDTSANYSVVGDNAFWATERVRWDVQENYVYARRSFEWVDGSDNTDFALETANDQYVGATLTEDGQPYLGAVIAAFRIESHFDIRREYNPTTGEEINVITENMTDRPWFDREYMRVDWSENLATDFDFDYFYYARGELRVEPLAYYVQENGPEEYRPLFDYDDGGDLNYFDFITQVVVHPSTSYYEWWDADIPTCWFFVHEAVDCASTVMTVRNSFLRVDDEEEDFEALEFKGRIGDVFGFWTVARMRVDHRDGLREYQRRRFAQVHNIWEQSHTDDTCQTNDDCEQLGSRCDDNVGLTAGVCETPWDLWHFDESCETDDDCTLPGSRCDAPLGGGTSQCTIPEASAYTSRSCDTDEQCPGDTNCLLAGRCTIPYADREPKPIIFYFTGGWPEDLGEVFDVVEDEYDRAFRRAVAAAQGHQDEDSVRQMFYFCHSPVRPDDPSECGPEGRVVRPGDMRYNQMYFTREWNPLSPLGMSPTTPDPLSGRIFGTQITLYDTHDLLARRVLETCQLINGQLDPEDYINGVNLDHWVTDMGTNHRHSRTDEAGDFDEDEVPTDDGFGDSHGGGARGIDHEDILSMYRARDTEWMELLREPDPRATPDGYSHELMPELMNRLRATGAFDADRDPGDAFLHSLHRSPLEALMMNDETLMMSNHQPGTPLTDDVLRTASIASPEYQMWRDARQRWFERHQFRRNMLLVDLDNLAYEALARRVADMEEEEAFNYIRHQIYLSTVIHELGHGMGLYHNFAGSEDTVNFPREWWSARTDEFTRRPRTRLEDPVTDSEIENGLAEYGYTSVMDYSANYAMGLTLGRYDRAALLYGYGRSIEVYQEVSGGLTPSDLEEYWSSAGSFLRFSSGRPQAMHYTEMYNLMGQDLFDESNRRIVSADGLLDDMVTWVDPDDEDAMAAFRVPYLYCNDYRADLGENCHRWDFGYDVYERMQYYQNQEAFWYLSSNFRRGSIRSDAEGFVGRVYERFYERFKQMHDYYVLIDSIINQYYDADAREEFMTDLTRGWGAYTVAMHDGFNVLARSLTRPDVNIFDRMHRGDGTEVWSEAGWEGPTTLNLEVGDGRYFTTTWWDTNYDDDCGNEFWECLHHYGFYMNKLMALMIMGQAETFFVARDTAEDIRQWRISFFDDYAPQILRLVGGMLSEDYTDIAPYVVPADPEVEGSRPEFVLRDYADPSLDPVATLPADARPIDPYAGFTVQLYAAVLGFARMHTNFDNRFITSSRLWVDGSDHGVDEDDIDTVCFEDPETYLRYCAVAREDGLGIAQRMIMHANLLRSRCDLCNRDDPTALDACVSGVSPAFRARAEREMLLYRDQLDFMVNLTARYDNWAFTYGDPFSPGDVPPDWD